MQKMIFTDILSSILANYVNKNQKTNVTGTEIQLLYFLHNNKEKISSKDISEKTGLRDDLVEFMLSRLQEQELVTRASPEWILTAKGESVVKRVIEVYPQLQKAVDKDPYLNDINKISSKGLIYK